jgi:ElaB/YqjD/DUF883 family membrane-anchored ribosome-binding protein
MINPSNEDFMEDDPLAASMHASEEQILAGVEGRGRQRVRRVSDAAGRKWEQTKSSAGKARERTEFFLRENPVPTVLGALAIGLAIGLAIRYASRAEEKETEIKTPLGNLDLSVLSLPFLLPLFKSVKRSYNDSTDAVKSGVDRLKNVDVDRYVKPIRKRWKAWRD